MRKIHYYLLSAVFATLLMCTSCMTSKSYFDQQGTTLIVGQGGGFTGAVLEYLIHSDGKVYFYESFNKPHDTTFVKQFTQKDLKAISKEVHKSGFMKSTINQTGNYYYYIELRQPGQSPHRVTWGANPDKAPQQFVALHKWLMNKIKEGVADGNNGKQN